MIEIVLDSHNDNTFLNEIRPVYTINSFSGATLENYRTEALDFIKKFADERIVIIRTPATGFSINMFALALFIESCHTDNNIDCVVFKVKDDKKALAEYKPFVALTIGIKYVMRLCNEDVKRIYHEFTELGYLGIDIERDFTNHKTFIRLEGAQPLVKITTNATGDAIAAVGMIKALSLAKTGANIELEINDVFETDTINETNIINKIVNDVRPWIQ